MFHEYVLRIFLNGWDGLQRCFSCWSLLILLCNGQNIAEYEAYWQWEHDIMQLSTSQPHATYSAMIHGLSSRWTFLSRTVKDLSSFLAPLEKAIRLHLLPKLCIHPPNDSERALLALLIRLEGLGIFDPCKSSEESYQVSVSITHPLWLPPS